MKHLAGKTISRGFALLALLAAYPIPGSCADGFDVRPVVQIPTGAPRVQGAKELDVSKYLRANDRLVLSQKMDVDEDGNVYLNFDRVARTGWKDVPEEKIFEMDHGKPPTDSNELKEWRESRAMSPKTTSDAERRAAWEEFRQGKRRNHPGFEPAEERRPLFVKVDVSGKVLEVREHYQTPARSAFRASQEISAEELAWFKKHASLSEFSEKREKIMWRDQGQVKSVERTAEFRDGVRLGEDGRGNTVYLLTITMPFLRPHRHGTSDYAARVYVISPEKKIIQVTPAYEAIQMHTISNDLYELYQGPYEGLMPALDDPRVKPLVVRVWKAK